MRKSTVFISAVLTTFALVMLYSLVSAYRGNKNVIEASSQPTATFTPEPTETPAPTETILTPERAAQLAAQVVGHDNLLSAESANINGIDAYKITFTNNDIVYVALDGQVLSVQVAPVVVNIAPPINQKKQNHDGGGGGGNVINAPPAQESGEDNHEEHDD